LVLACSSRKVASTELLPAIERYDGVAYRVVKRLQRLGEYPVDVDLLILSAKYGLIRHDHPIHNYDLRMTSERALEHANATHIFMRQCLSGGCYSEVFISAGKDYVLALEPFDSWRGGIAVSTNKGKIGIQLKTLKEWLLRESNIQGRAEALLGSARPT
jgi:hypothetical protein